MYSSPHDPTGVSRHSEIFILFISDGHQGKTNALHAFNIVDPPLFMHQSLNWNSPPEIMTLFSGELIGQ